MAKKATKITLFNKNHITITKDTNIKNNYCCVWVRNVYTNDSYSNSKRVKEEIKCESPLGFYYTKTVYKTKESNSSQTEVIEISLPTETYTITYLSSFNNNSISQTLRPWSVCEGDKSMQDHFILALKKIIDDMLMIIEENKLNITVSQVIGNNSTKEFKWLKDKLYSDLFGSTKGIRFQTDEEKILSHGFDLKTSFRK